MKGIKQIKTNSKSSNVKRGLINGLGSIIKVVTRNVDATDAEKYQSAINELQTNQKEITHFLNKQLSPNKDIINSQSTFIEVEQLINFVITTITLRKNNIINERLIETTDLQKMITTICNLYPSSNILSLQELHSYYKLFSVQAYLTENNLNILLDFSLTTGFICDYIWESSQFRIKII